MAPAPYESEDAFVSDRAAHEKPDSAASGAGGPAFGVGEMPPALERFNWGAFFLAPLWGIAHGSAAVLGWWLLSVIATFSVAGLAADTAAPTIAAGASTLSTVIGIAIRLWVGMNANRWLWRREQLRLQVLGGARPRFSVHHYEARQRGWLAAGVVLTVVSFAGLGVLGFSDAEGVRAIRDELQVTSLEIALVAGWSVAEIVFALWLAARMRREAIERMPRIGV